MRPAAARDLCSGLSSDSDSSEPRSGLGSEDNPEIDRFVVEVIL
jgi:hypothetical protein